MKTLNLHGWIIYNGQLSGNKFIDFANWLKEAASRRHIKTTIYKNNEVISYINHHSFELLREKDSSLPDFVLFTDKDIYLARQFELMGIPVFNNARSIEVSDDKIASYQALASYNLPIPKTIIHPKTFHHSERRPIYIDHVIDTLSLPLIIKEAYGSFGEQVYLIHTKEDVLNKMEELSNKPYVFQEFITSSYGKDARLHVVGNKVVAAMKRYNPNDFRANITSGGSMEAYTANEEEALIAIKAVKAIGADFAGVDLLFGSDDEPIICEVNSNAHIRNMYDATGIDASDFILDHVLDKITDGQVGKSC